MKNKLSAIFVICMLFMFSGCFSVYAENDEITENNESIVVDENPVIPENPEDTPMDENSENEKSSKNVLTIECRDNDILLGNMDWSIYKVAELDSNNTYIATDEFAKYNVHLNNLTTSQMVSVAETLEAYTHVDNLVPVNKGTTDSNGIVEFEELSYGLYLLSGSDVSVGDKYYMPAPSLVILDKLDESGISRWSYNVTTMPKLKVLAGTNRVYHYSGTVKKIWENDNEAMRPKSITVTLVKDGEKFSKVTLSEENNWTHTWDKLSSKYNWTVIEEDNLKGYSVIYSEKDININPDNPKEHDVEFTIVNRGNLTETQPPKVPALQADVKPAAHSKNLPQTGQLWWPVPAMSALGLIVFGAGWKFNSHKRKQNEK